MSFEEYRAAIRAYYPDSNSNNSNSNNSTNVSNHHNINNTNQNSDEVPTTNEANSARDYQNNKAVVPYNLRNNPGSMLRNQDKPNSDHNSHGSTICSSLPTQPSKSYGKNSDFIPQTGHLSASSNVNSSRFTGESVQNKDSLGLTGGIVQDKDIEMDDADIIALTDIDKYQSKAFTPSPTKESSSSPFQSTYKTDYNQKNSQKKHTSDVEQHSTGTSRSSDYTQKNHQENSKYPYEEPQSTVTTRSKQNIPEKILIPKSFIPCLKGLTNHGNTCYFNALMQCLAGCDLFAEFLCNDFVTHNKNTIFKSFVHTIRCMWFNNNNVDNCCRKTVQSIANENSTFRLGSQHDSHECMIWLLNKINQEILDFNLEGDYGKGWSMDSNVEMIGTSRSFNSKKQLAIGYGSSSSFNPNNDNIDDKKSTVHNLFQGQFRHEIKCSTPNCDYSDTSFETFLSVSLSVPLPRKVTVKFINQHPIRKITRFHFNISDDFVTVQDIMEQLENVVKVSKVNMVACKIMPDGRSTLVSHNTVIESDKQLNNFTILEIPGRISETLLQNYYVIAIINFVIGGVPDGKMFGEPFIARLSGNLNYDSLRLELMDRGTFLLPKLYSDMAPNFTILLQNSDRSVYFLDPKMKEPLFNKFVTKAIYEKENDKRVIQIIAEWDLSVKKDFENYSMKEKIEDNHSLLNKFNDAKQAQPISLITMLDNFVKTEPIQYWDCPKCKNTTGFMRIIIDYLPDILVFYLKRFDMTGRYTKKNDKAVQIPLEGLDMSSYINEQNSKNYNQNNYDLSGIIFHHGSQFSSGHYTAATRNSVDGKWRLFNDSIVSEKLKNEISESTCSYMLFYQRKKSFQWFPKEVPNNIIDKYYQGKRDYEDKNDQSYAKQRKYLTKRNNKKCWR
uniref:Ubiquitin carboxyl-terminal hydrolase n=1 Tax=Meloidogyne hapla TaxID=6305 RepID=A0A1I8B2Y3_MELHA